MEYLELLLLFAIVLCFFYSNILKHKEFNMNKSKNNKIKFEDVFDENFKDEIEKYVSELKLENKNNTFNEKL